ncbi:MAG: hypothetical protein IJV43_05605 [Oscillospiraceae bacterium]|nr:hypothetical protein [Oscillospiraceae bacterium]
MESQSCPRCDTPMRHMSTEYLQLGKMNPLIGAWPNLFAGGLKAEIQVCPNCRKLEFFYAGELPEEDAALPQRTCPNCGCVHDFDYGRCPRCHYEY